jgi:Fe-S cluster assembly ATP-binding protein
LSSGISIRICSEPAVNEIALRGLLISCATPAARNPTPARILVTHYQRLLNFIVPDLVHVLANGRIVKEGGKELALELEEKGYDWVKGAAAK